MNLSPEEWRLGIFLGLLASLAVLEAMFPKRRRNQDRRLRWVTNLGLSVTGSLTVILMGPLVAIIAAVYAAERGWGLLNVIDLPIWAEFIIAFLCLDLAIYTQHVLTHRILILWQLHKVHHADRDIDVTTGVRFHPIEIGLSMLYKCAVVILVGPAVILVMAFEIILNGCALFNHSNLRLPRTADAVLRFFIVTPDMHRVHHSADVSETHRNFGFSLSIWDHLFRTYKPQPKLGHDQMIIGLPDHQKDSPSRFIWSIMLPFRR